MPHTVLSEGRNATKARVRLITWEGRTAVEKDYSVRGWLVRRVLGPRLLDREESALRRLHGIAGVPGWWVRPARERLVMEYLEGATLREWTRRNASHLPGDFFARLRQLVEILHRRGVTQGDIGAADVLVRAGGAPGLVDFSVSVQRGRGIAGRVLFGAAMRQDHRRVARLEQRFAPASLSAAARALLQQEPAWHRWARRLRALVPGRRRAGA